MNSNIYCIVLKEGEIIECNESSRKFSKNIYTALSYGFYAASELKSSIIYLDMNHDSTQNDFCSRRATFEDLRRLTTIYIRDKKLNVLLKN